MRSLKEAHQVVDEAREDATREATGTLFGDLWHRYDDDLFEESVGLFSMRFAANGFDVSWFEGKAALDVGCGGGRYVIAMARLGATPVVGCDISETGLADAARRAEGSPHISFRQASTLDLPFDDAEFDFVCCSGVLHHTPDAVRGLAEVVRVTKPGGKIYLLLYGSGGLRWPTIVAVRPYAQTIGYDLVDRAMTTAGLPANKQRTFLDDLFVPLIDFYDEPRMAGLLASAGLDTSERWLEGKLDHEESVEVQREELEQLRLVFTTIAAGDPEFAGALKDAGAAEAIVAGALAGLDAAEDAFTAGTIGRDERDSRIFGAGHHRILATKPAYIPNGPLRDRSSKG